jgi:GTPase
MIKSSSSSSSWFIVAIILYFCTNNNAVIDEVNAFSTNVQSPSPSIRPPLLCTLWSSHRQRRYPSSSQNIFNVRLDDTHHYQTINDDQESTTATISVATDTDDDVVTYYSPNKPLIYGNTERGDTIESSPDDEDTLATSAIDGTASEYSFFDEARVRVRAGSGGQGSSTYKKGAGGQDGPPDGGNGGKGGDLWLRVDPSLNTLAGLTPSSLRPNAFGGSGAAVNNQQSSGQNTSPRIKSFRAENGIDGGRQMKNGRFGQDMTVRVPPGTIVHEIIEIKHPDGDITEREIELGTLLLDDCPELRVAAGGQGGEGSGVNAKGRGVQRPRLPPQGGERKLLKLTLKLVADVALVAVPNAGKSTFLAAVTRAKPKIANYPFTTVIPNLGVWVPPETDEYRDGNSSDSAGGNDGLVLCDVPGLIQGAAKGAGLGHAFLRHVERCHVILHLIDASSNDPLRDFEMINKELVQYGTGQLAQMPQVVVVNKLDLLEGGNSGHTSETSDSEVSIRGQEEWEKGLKTRFNKSELESKLKEAMSHSRLMWMSAKDKDGVDDLMIRLSSFVKKVKSM